MTANTTQKHNNVITYRTNSYTLDDSIMMWSATGTRAGTYANYTLSVTDGKDADGHEALTYTDNMGRLVMKREVVSAGNYYDTYYTYYADGQVRYIIPPKASSLLYTNPGYTLSTAAVSNLIFRYSYDSRGRVTIKTIPGNIKANTVYDPLNRPVLVQDANMAKKYEWNYISYDVKGRVASQGIYTNTTDTTQALMQSHVSSQPYTYYYENRSTDSTKNYYTQQAFPNSNIKPLSYAYYDNYTLGTHTYGYSSKKGLPNEETATIAPVKGMATISRETTVGAGVATGVWLTKVMFYDKRLNAIQVQSSNHINNGGTAMSDYVTNVPDFMGMPTVTKVSKKTGTHTVAVWTYLNYDNNYRITTITQQYNSGSMVTVGAYSYNEIGQLVTKVLGNNLQTLNYLYNIRGQLLSLNSSSSLSGTNVFGMELVYDVSSGTISNTPSYTGNLTAIKWMSKDTSGNTTNERCYKYFYDKLDRYTSASYGERLAGSGTSFTINAGGFNENGITYDENGNIQSLKRESLNGSTQTAIDSLTYTYNTSKGNQLLKVTDATGNNLGFGNFTGSTGSYAYDAEGNMITDPYKGLSLSYNVLNKTDTIQVTTGSGGAPVTGKYIVYTYDASGNVIRKQQYTSGTISATTDYIDGFVYSNGLISYFPTPEGRVVSTSGTLTSQYTITDQQGNARISFVDDGTGHAKVIQENSYYGTGLMMANSPVALPAVPNKNLYNGGSEWQDDYSNLLNYYQATDRNYDPAIARFVASDPMADATESMSTYQYANDNPVMGNDPMGERQIPHFPPNMGPRPVNTTQGEVAWDDSGSGDGGVSAFMKLTGPSTPIQNDYSQKSDSEILAEAKAGDPAAVAEYVKRNGKQIAVPAGTTPGDVLADRIDPTPDVSTYLPGASQYNTSSLDYSDFTSGGDPGIIITEHTVEDDAANQGGEIFPGAAAILGAAAYSYPPNDGFVGTPLLRQTVPGEILTRYGGTRPVSEYFSPPGATYDQRYLPPETDQSIYQEWRVLKPFDIMEAPIAGPDGLPTGGIQYRSLTPYGGLTQPGNEYIEPVEPSTWQIIEDIAEKYFEDE